MTKKGKIVLAVAVSAVSLILIAAGVASIVMAADFLDRAREYYSDTHVYELHWSVKFPEDMKILYSVSTGPSFHGDGDSYTVYDTEGVAGIDEFIARFDTGEPGDKDMSGFSRSKLPDEKLEDVKSILLSAGDDGRYTDDDLEGEYMWFTLKKSDGSHVYFIYLPDRSRLHVIERLI